MPLTLLQSKFCLEYVICDNAWEAALKAGYCKNAVNKAKKENRQLNDKEKSLLYRQASILLTKHEINEEINRLVAESQSDETAKLHDILVYLTTVMNNEKVEEKDRLRAASELLKRFPVDSGNSGNYEAIVFTRR